MRVKQIHFSSLSFLLALFTSAAAKAQFSFTNSNSKLNNSDFHSGVATTVIDVDNDGLDDIVRMDQGQYVYIEFQKTNAQFQTQYVGDLGSGSAWAMCVSDVNHDGYKDVIADGSGGIVLFKSVSGGASYVSSLLQGSGFFLQNANFVDVNNDGWEDIFGCDDNAASHIWLNDGTGNFTGSNIINFNLPNGSDNSGNYGSTWIDFDNDGDVDLYIAKCRQGVNNPSDYRRIDVLFVNNGDGTYTESAATYGIANGAQTWTASFGDLDNDADLDLMVTNHDVPSQIFRNDGTGHYTDITNTTGFNLSITPIESVMEDFDNDGFLDILVTGSFSQLFRNNGNMTFSLQQNPFDNNSMESFAIGDLNHDGKVDIYASYATIYTNPTIINDVVWLNSANNSNHFITVDLEGTTSNIGALGARATIYGDWGKQIREVRAGESYGTCNSSMLHFGLGENTTVDSLVVTWPSGNRSVIITPQLDQFITIIENNCTSVNNIVNTSGSLLLCSGQTLDLTATSEGQAYLWSDGSTSETLMVTQSGEYNVRVSNGNCSSVSQTYYVTVTPDETPVISASSGAQFCQGGQLELSSSSASSYLWNTNETTQSIIVTQSGDYTVTIQGSCSEFTSNIFHVEVLPVDVPLVNDVYISSPQSVTLSATGDEIHWFDNSVGGTELAIGTTYITPVISSDATYYIENWVPYGSDTISGGKLYSEGLYSGASSTNALTSFDVYSSCILKSVKVYTDIPGERNIEIYDGTGNLINSLVVDIPMDSSIIMLNFPLVPGSNYTIRTDASYNQALWGNDSPRLQRSISDVGYPYWFGNALSITGSDQGSSLYYYFYDWTVELSPNYCISNRVPVNINYSLVSISDMDKNRFSISPNPAGSYLNINFSQNFSASIANIYDVNGRNVLSFRFNAKADAQQLNISSLSKGLYSLKLGDSQSVRFIKD